MVDAERACQIKSDSEAVILRAGGEICDWLPHIGPKNPRPLEEVVDRAAILNAMLQIYFRAPTHIIADWIDRNGLRPALSPKESDLLELQNADLTEQNLTDLYWYIEALWALLWATQLIEEMPFDRGIDDFMAGLCPNLQQNEDASKFRNQMRLRPFEELFRMLDLHFRLHWWTFNAHLTGNDTGNVQLDIIMERRKALEWLLDQSYGWDDVPLNT